MTKQARLKIKKFNKIIRTYSKLIIVFLLIVIIILVIIIASSGCDKKNEVQVEVTTDVDAGEVVAVDQSQYGHVPELTQAGYVVHGGNEKEGEWKIIANQPDAARNTYLNQYWQNDNGWIKYTEPGYTSSIGIDVSEMVGDIDWAAVAGSGAEFAIIRLGYRGYGEYGSLVEDVNYAQNIEGALANGIKVGAYFISQATSEEEAREEADFCLSLVEGYEIELPIYLDLEVITVEGDTARTEGLSKEEITTFAVAFCEHIIDSGHKTGIYANQTWFTDKMILSQVDKYDIWFAKYTSVPDYPYKFDMWQYTESASVPGINAGMDMNVRITK